MDLPAKVFDFLKSTNALQDAHVGKRKKNAVSLTTEATRAVTSGHVAFFTLRNIMSQRGMQVSQTVAGNPGEVVASDVTHFNWSVVCEMLQKVGVQLSPDHRMLLGCGDPGIIADLLRTMEARLSGAPPVVGGAKSPSPTRNRGDPTNRAGAVSVDQGKARLKQQQQQRDDGSTPPPRFDAFKDLEKIRKKREEKLARQKEDADKLAQVEQRMKANRDKLTAQNDARKGLLDEINISNAPLPCYLEFKNRSNVQMCHQLVMSMVTSVVQGEAQEMLAARENERKKARELALKRKTEGDRFLAGGMVTVPRDADHRSVVMCRSIVYELITIAMLPETKLLVEQKERLRAFANDNAAGVRKKIDQLYDMRRQRQKYSDEKKVLVDQVHREREEKKKKYEEMRKENEERARSDFEEQQRLRQEKDLAAKRKDEESKKKEAERMLYYAEQKAKVLEARRANAVDDEIKRARDAETERTVREERRQRTIEISKKLMEKEMKREAAQQAHGTAPTSLSPFSVGTGQRSGYTGATLGWKFLTDDERVVAELLHNVRSEPEEGIGIITSRMANTKGNVVWYTDQSGRRHPLTLAEGPEVHENALETLRRYSKRSTASIGTDVLNVNMSIALTLAARCHAADLAYHGIADAAVWHIGTDGASATQRVGKFGTGLGGPGTTQEIVVAVVRPEDVKLSATDIIGFALVDDGCPTRENREALLKSVAASSGAGTECCGVGHAIAACGDDTVVEVFVILFTAGTYTDKPVAHMAAAQFNLLSACAAPFLENDRSVSKSIRSKKDLYKLNNVTIGRRTEGLKQGRLLRLAEGRKVPPKPTNEEDAPPPQLKKKASSRRRSQSSASEYEAAPSEGPHQNGQVDDDDVPKESLHRRRLSSFFQRYAPDKVAVVDTALALNEGREDEMFQKLADKYGPEPTPPDSPSELSRSRSSHGDEATPSPHQHQIAQPSHQNDGEEGLPIESG
ncbi:Hypothetical protein, putative [Bodo saltans]|uniref:Uncharacterized protein n=1 Tax=Bodo saltans TaxID=75058 RepID=A0A0S4JQP3_BODSA|nr:Hypothetical protein, putative [Bodo saltans]|eukprot:CUG91367.1 Hypothetical protein, putative [Bodo saltans]